MADDELIPFSRLAELAANLRESWLTQHSIEVRRSELAQPQRLYGVHPLAAHVHELAPTVFDLFRDDRPLAAIPLVRVMYECAMTAQWIQLRSDAANAFLNEDIRKRRVTAKKLTEAASEVFRGSGVAGADSEDLDTAAGGQARNFEQLCKDLSSTSDPYIYYRLMSWYVHPSITLTDTYLDPREGEEWPQLLRTPTDSLNETYPYIAVCSMVWSGRAVDMFDVDHVRRSQLWSAAQELGIRDRMQLSPDANTAVYRFERDQKRSRRRGKRSKRT